MIAEAAALRDDCDGVARAGGYAWRLIDAREGDDEAVDEVGIAKTIGADDRNAAVARHLADLFLAAALLVADFGEAGRKHDGGADFSFDANCERFFDAGGRHGEHGHVYVVG